ncbi:MAG: hypothetical protein QM752_01385 [Gammaproteobacteria bacterium]
MVQAIRQEMTIVKENTLEIHSPLLKAGFQVEVIVLVDPAIKASTTSLGSFLGKGQGSFKSPEEVDKFIRNERDMWQ